MKVYADSTARFLLQLSADVLFVSWLIAWGWIASVVHAVVLRLDGPTQTQLDRLAFWLAVSVALVPMLVAGLAYLPRRIRFVLEANATQRMVEGPADVELFALRAVSTRPLHTLLRVTPDPLAALQRNDRPVIERLARLELGSQGRGSSTNGRQALE